MQIHVLLKSIYRLPWWRYTENDPFGCPSCVYTETDELVRVYVPSFGAAAMQVFPVSPLDVATMSAAVNAVTKAMARKIFLIIVVCP